MATLSTHVLDTARGRPASGLRIILESDAKEKRAGRDGHRRRRPGPGPRSGRAGRGHVPAAVRLGGPGSPSRGIAGFYPEVVVAFRLSGDEHFHVPLLLSPFGYSTYRGS